MARKRDIDPSFWSNEQLGAVPRDARLLFAGLISFADDEGRLKASAGYLRATVFPYDTDLSADEVAGWLHCLTLAGLVCTYEVERGQVAHLPTWHAWQAINRRFDSKIPPCPKHGPCPEHEPSGSGDNLGNDHSHTSNGHISELSLTSEQQVIDEWLSSNEQITDGSSTTVAGTVTVPGRTEEFTVHESALESVQPTRRKRRSDSAALVVPDSVRAFHDALSEIDGYAPTQAFLDKVAQKYTGLDLVEEAIKIKGWLRVHPGQRRDVTAFALNWLKKGVEQPSRRAANSRPVHYINPHQPTTSDPQRAARRAILNAERAAKLAAIEAAETSAGAAS